ncbi:hypothetical protein QAD02_018499 [Eretmocerus hayati]|uniref:Uncharacterized protein n=1 Tax=Eretmocerus hayati TaxID=131215 RepID=A0ACC2PJX0_9HYME|nr:hypothetical protein QAD02_018499 [Eretmocerus hayati]
MAEDSSVKVFVEYCGECGHINQFFEMAEVIKQSVPDAKIYGRPGRQASFEVQINDKPVYSKLRTLAFPDFEEVSQCVKNVSEGIPCNEIHKQQPIKCVIS